MRDYDPTIDTIERWGEEMFKHILATGQVDDWTGDPEMSQTISLRKTIAQQGEQIETLLTQSEDLKSESSQLTDRLRKSSWLNILFGSAAIILLLVAIL